ncbi:MAG: HNH endonuclease [Bryobacterales bacterium]|nr:HNH endonuclease [Bryobacterales bacterium]
MDQATMCAAGEGTERAAIPHAVAMEVFRRYGIHDPRPRAYEVDYLIPPDLGGTEDERNLWPQPYNEGTWNARVKDALEDRLRTMVCEGGLALDTAQAELAGDWIGAYKRHFRTATPLPDHVAFVKDRPWE